MLDGGWIFFGIIEMIRGRSLPGGFLWPHRVGLMFVVSFMLLAIYNDLVKQFHEIWGPAKPPAGPSAIPVCRFPGRTRNPAVQVHDVRVEGLQRLPVERVYAELPIQAGDTVDRDQIVDAVQRLFATGNFEDVQLGRDGDDLVVVVAERPSIARIDLSGNKSIDEENLRKGLTEAGLVEGEVFQRSTLQAIAGELERQYVSQGRYGADIKTESVPLPRNRVALKIEFMKGRPPASAISISLVTTCSMMRNCSRISN